MQVFVLDKDPVLAARYHCDKHVVKMIVETCQLLCTAHHLHGSEQPPYRKTHVNHPCAIWARESRANYDWLIQLGFALSDEYTLRYHKTHKSLSVLEWLDSAPIDLPAVKMTPFAQAVPEIYRSADAVATYREFYKEEKSSFAVWKYTEKPEWF